MATFQRIPFAGNIVGQNVFRFGFSVNPSSDIPRLTAWDDFNMNSVVKQTIAGTAANGNVSSVCGASTHAGATTAGWATGLATTAGGAAQNRLRGNTSFVLLGTTPPAVGEFRTFQLAIGVNADSAPGTVGHDIVLGLTVFYTTANPPTVTLQYNSAPSEAAPVWVGMNLQARGVSTVPPLPNTIFATGPDSTVSALDPVTRPDTGEKFSEQYWSRTA